MTEAWSTPTLGLRVDRAFLLNHDDRFFFGAPRFAEHASAILDGIDAGAALQLVLGEPGSGKTCFLVHLVAELRRAGRPAAWLPHVPRRSSELLSLVLEEHPGGSQESLRDWMVSFDGRPPVLVMDDLDAAGREAIEALAQVCDAVLGGRVVASGLPGFTGRFSGIADAAVLRLDRLLPAESVALVQSRLVAAGFEADALFTPSALARIAAVSQGVPERIVMLSGRSLTVARRAGARRVSSQFVEQAAAEICPRPPAGSAFPAGECTRKIVG